MVTGGGSGGHAATAISAVEALRKRGYQDFVYVGSYTGLERDLARAYDIPYVAIETGKLRRGARRYGAISWANTRDVVRVLRGLRQSAAIVSVARPAVVFAAGGYVAVPPSIASHWRRIPVVIHEQTLQLGLANRLLAPLATYVAISHNETLKLLPRRHVAKTCVTGNPVREEIPAGRRDRAYARFELNDALQTVAIFGGGQGSRRINTAILGALPRLMREANVVHQSGAAPSLVNDEHRLRAAAARCHDGQGVYRVIPFMDTETIADTYAIADLVIARSGAGTTNELAATGKPSILIPLVPTQRSEQEKLAARMAAEGAAVVIQERELTPDRIATEALSVLRDRARLSAMATAALRLDTSGGAAERIALVVERAMTRSTIEAPTAPPGPLRRIAKRFQ
jgi:UDP-N-acetylglucosamine--N-acetylmuramyl-(pentapeptide) pyrophosphoryl-undecaprenol N-acetylglucosamine transferase